MPKIVPEVFRETTLLQLNGVSQVRHQSAKIIKKLKTSLLSVLLFDKF
jgi:hypothetical protein